MRAPRVHLFVCTNRREGSPLGPGCGAAGDELYAQLKEEVGRRGVVADVWVTRTHCLGVCPKEGATVARYPASAILEGARDAAAILDDALDAPAPIDEERLARELAALEELQKKKVIDLARRLKPGLTDEDIQNPHDFPELDDRDWHYADGVLTGVQSAASLVRALRKG
jgi:(2Fe-2S) ferredoxin